LFEQIDRGDGYLLLEDLETVQDHSSMNIWHIYGFFLGRDPISFGRTHVVLVWIKNENGTDDDVMKMMLIMNF
jgi:hypothetical protein